MQVGRRRERDRQGDLGQVVALVGELRHEIEVEFFDPLQALAHAAHDAFGVAFEDAGVGLDDQLEVATDGRGQGEGGAVGDGLAGLQEARLGAAAGEQVAPHAQQDFGLIAAVH